MDFEREKRVRAKLEIMSDLEGSELGDGAGAALEILDGSSLSYILDEATIEAIWKDAEASCDAYFEQVAEEALREQQNGWAPDSVLELGNINDALGKAGCKEIWPDGFEMPSEEDLEKQGKCKKHPWQTYFSTPRNGCETCVRIYVAKQDAKKATK